MKQKISLTLTAIAACVVISSCSSVKKYMPTLPSGSDPVPSISGGLPGDGAGRKLNAKDIQDAVVKDEPRSRGGNKSPYRVNGRLYYVLDDARDYVARGVASWYGSKFHGNLTANGETYDMYAMSAAHRNLPLPTYVEVRNLDNGRTAIVRVNDRGPFVEDRIIDLSYAAAVKLDMLKSGTANVEVRAVFAGGRPEQGPTDIRTARTLMPEPAAPVMPTAAAPLMPTASPPPMTPVNSNVQYLHVGSHADLAAAQAFANSLQRAINKVQIHRANGKYQVVVGPVANKQQESVLIGQLQRLKITKFALINLPGASIDCVSGC